MTDAVSILALLAAALVGCLLGWSSLRVNFGEASLVERILWSDLRDLIRGRTTYD